MDKFYFTFWTKSTLQFGQIIIKKRIKLNFFEYKTVNFNNINDSRFEDTDILSGVEYKYSVEANDEFGLVSDKTDETSLTIPKLK